MKRTTMLGLLSLALATALAAGCATDDASAPGDYTVSADDQIEDAMFDRLAADSKADGALGYQATAQVAHNAGLACSGDRIALAVAVAKAESGLRPTATNIVGNLHGTDRGLWQINSYFHPDVAAACAFSPSCNARAMASISHSGTTWRAWWTYNNGKHLQFMAAARAAQAAICP